MAPSYNSSRPNTPGFAQFASRLQPGIAFIVMIFGALIAFEIFNYSTTDHALRDLLGDLTFAGLPWATVLAIAFCGIDFAGIARLFTPEQGADEPKEVWYLFGAWLLAATMNAILTWWGVAIAVAGHPIESTSIMDQATLLNVVPVFVAVMVWVIRILIIGTLSLAMDRQLHPGVEQRLPLQHAISTASHAQPQPAAPRQSRVPAVPQPVMPSVNNGIQPRPSMSRAAAAQQRAAARMEQQLEADFENLQPMPVRPARPEPTYHTLGMTAAPRTDGKSPAGENGGSNRFRRS